jgi:peptidoglycan/LPS O-acetylase OafA/YrhL
MPNAITASKQHIPQVDYIRAIASLMVAVFHLGGKGFPIVGYGWVGVEMFFFLSGFIICWSIPTNYNLKMAGTFILKRIVRIEPPYLFSMGIALLVNILWDVHYKFNWTDILFHLAYLNNFFGRPYLSVVYWTLGIEFQYYLFIALFFPFIIRKWGAWAITSLCFLPIFIGARWGLLTTVFTFFSLGILYYLYLKGIKKISEVLLLGIIISVLGVYEQTLAQTLAALLALLLLILPLKSNAIVSFFSKISFSLYLTHEIIGTKVVTYLYLYTKLPHGIMSKAISFVCGMAVSIVAAYLFYKLIEAPCFRLSKKIRYSLTA